VTYDTVTHVGQGRRAQAMIRTQYIRQTTPYCRLMVN